MPRLTPPSLSSLAAALLLALLPACGDAGGAADSGAQSSPPPGAVGLGQAGAQDFGLFPQILEDGGIPHPDVLDDRGFFAEHKLDYPAADCGDDVCIHGLLGVMGNLITGSNCTIIQIGLNTPIDPSTLTRPPLDLVLGIDVSGSMSGAPIEAVRAGLLRMLDHLVEGDTISIVTYSDESLTRAVGVPIEERREIEEVISLLAAGGRTNLYAGLYEAFEVADTLRDPEREARVVFLSDGEATTGIVNPERMHDLAAAWAATGIGLTTIGVGDSFDVEVMRGLAEVGAGNFYFLEDPQAVREVFTEEVQTFLHPVALDVEIEVAAGPAYSLRRAYGTHRFTGGLAGGRVSIPSLFLAGRTRAGNPIEGGRRGGGGAILLELMPRSQAWLSGAALTPDQLAEAGQLTLSWTHPVTGERHHGSVRLTNPYAPGDNPPGGHFTSATVEKGFVMLNLFAGFQMAAGLANDHDPGAARGVLTSLRERVAAWLVDHPDPDIDDDLRYVDLFLANLDEVAFQTPADRAARALAGGLTEAGDGQRFGCGCERGCGCASPRSRRHPDRCALGVRRRPSRVSVGAAADEVTETVSVTVSACSDDATDQGGPACGFNGNGTQDRACVSGEWVNQGTCSNDPDVCANGAEDQNGTACGFNDNGSEDRSCANGQWVNQGTCSNDPDVCANGAEDQNGTACGFNDNGTEDRSCANGQWVNQDTCSNDPDVCADDATDQSGPACGFNDNGTEDRLCVSGQWVNQGTCSNDPDVCANDATDRSGPACDFNDNGTEDRACVDGQWVDQGTCSNDPDECANGVTDQNGTACGFNDNGTEDRLCVGGAWVEEETCSNDPDECADDDTQELAGACGLGSRGALLQTCVEGSWVNTGCERLCRYIARPAIAEDRLFKRDDGRVELRLKRTWRGGVRALVFEPLKPIARTSHQISSETKEAPVISAWRGLEAHESY